MQHQRPDTAQGWEPPKHRSADAWPALSGPAGMEAMKELQRLLDRLVAAGAPGAVGWVQDEGVAAGAVVSTLEDLSGFLRALLGGRLLPPALLAEMLPTVPVPPASIPLPLYDRYAWGCWRPRCPPGAWSACRRHPWLLNVVLSTHDGRRQLGVMVNVLAAPDVVSTPSCRWSESSACSSPR